MSLVRKPPEQFQTSVVRPPDFDAFWQATLQEAAAIPLDARVEPVPLRSTPEVAVFDVHYASWDGLEIAAWYCTPNPDHIPPPYPGLLLVPGYISEPVIPKVWARRGYAALAVSPRGKLRSHARFNAGYPGLLTRDAVDRQIYGYRGFYVDACRGIDFLQSRPEVDAGRIGVHGHSQGGGLTIITSALRNDAVICGAAGAPYLCGYMDAARLTHSYPYEEINDELRLHPELEPRLAETYAYFDGINFAPLIRCPMLVYVGLADDVCPPETGYAVYNAMTCPKQIDAFPRCAHGSGSHWEMEKVLAFLGEHLRPATAGAPRVEA